MSRIMGMILAGGLVLGTGGAARAQVGVSVGNPYTGGGVYVGAPGISYAAPGYAYGSGYSGYAAPAYGYGNPAYGYSAYRPVYRAPVYRAYRPFGIGRGWRRPYRGYW
jgi:hypothetical protein